ncbi:APC10 protein, partial [Polyodon spathula]|nr:APC10 protein [Polyodon spathula]
MATAPKTPPGADPKQLERTGTIREIGSQAVWSLSSCKPGFGIDKLRDDNLETYWQSDGPQPHLINIQFRVKTTVKMLGIYADFKTDESYTPRKISVRVGNNFHNLQEIRSKGLEEILLWLVAPDIQDIFPALSLAAAIALTAPVQTADVERLFSALKLKLEMVEPSGWIHIPLLDIINNPIQTFMIQIALLSNHQNGRDTHMRQIKVYTPVEESSVGKFRRCTTLDFMMYRTIR